MGGIQKTNSPLLSVLMGYPRDASDSGPTSESVTIGELIRASPYKEGILATAFRSELFIHQLDALAVDDTVTDHRRAIHRLATTFQLPSLARHAAETAADLAAWGHGFPLADTRRFGALALTTGVHLPGLSRGDRALAARLNGWIYAFDDLVDGVPIERREDADWLAGWRLPDAALDQLATRCVAVVSGAPMRASDDEPGGVVAALADLVSEVRTRPCSPALDAFWRDTFQRMLGGILRERRLTAELAAGAAPPSPAAHLETARYSIGAPHYLATCFILHAGADDPLLSQRLPLLTALALAAADIARLANDLRTWVREEDEGTYNSVRAADAALGRLMPTLSSSNRRAQALQAVEHLLTVRTERVAALLAAGPVTQYSAEAGIARLVEFIPALYALADFHDFGGTLTA